MSLSNSGGSAVYSHLDADAPSSVIYYRVAAINVDGTIQYTNVAKLSAISQNPSIAVTPNPVSGNVISIDFRNMEGGEYNAILYNIEGKKISATVFHVSEIKDTKRMRVGMELPSGNYKLVIYKSGGHRYYLSVQIIR
mgnify:CR=1 FL=1